MKKQSFTNSQIINGVALGFSIAFFLAAAAAAVYAREWRHTLIDWQHLMTAPCPLITDYIALGGLSSAFLNAGACGLSCALFMIFLKGESRANTLAGYFLVVGHCFYGLNFLNMWPCFLAPFLYLRLKKLSFKKNLHICMFATAFSPFISEFLFRYLHNDAFIYGQPYVRPIGVVLAVLFSLMIGFLVPALLPGSSTWHKGYNLYNGGLAFGLFGFFLYSLMYSTMGVEPPERISRLNLAYHMSGLSYEEFATVFYIIVFLTCLICGYVLNGRSFKGYGDLTKDTGLASDFAEKYTMPVCLINMGVHGLLILLYMNIHILLFEGAGFTGPTIGVILAAMTFTAMGQHPKNVWPILLGYQVLFFTVMLLCKIDGRDIHWTLASQGFINSAAFATGLCPIAGRYGVRAGILAGAMCAALCSTTSAVHGGLVLYNGGFTTGITAMLLLPILEHYTAKARDEMSSASGFQSLISLVGNITPKYK